MKKTQLVRVRWVAAVYNTATREGTGTAKSKDPAHVDKIMSCKFIIYIIIPFFWIL
jgi:hypothetical protein